MHLSIVIPTFNRLARLQRVLAGLEHQTCSLADAEIIVISDGSTDGTNEWLAARAAGSLQKDLPLLPVIQANQGVAAARNAGLAQATGKVVLFIDDDVVPSPQLVAEHLATHAAHNDGVIVLGPMLTPPGFRMQAWVRWEQAMLVKQYDDMVAGHWAPTARQFYTGNTSLARRHLVESGGFDPAFRRAEDVELAYRLARQGLRFVFNANAIGYHYAERSFKSWLQTPYVYGRNDVIFTRDKGQSWLLPTIWNEYARARSPLIRGLVQLCLDRPLVAGPAIQLMRLCAALGDRLGIEYLSRPAYSGIFNLRHYQGIADELGGRQAFFAGIRQAT
jgi:glycosyltransferase involved in cell wall biosynthesis